MQATYSLPMERLKQVPIVTSLFGNAELSRERVSLSRLVGRDGVSLDHLTGLLPSDQGDGLWWFSRLAAVISVIEFFEVQGEAVR